VGVSFPAIEPPPRLPGFVWVYILEHADHSYYIGQSWDVAERLLHHRNGDGGKHPADHREPRLVYCEGPFPLAKGIARERQIKRWSRAKKEARMRGDLTTLRALSQSRETAQQGPRGDPDLASSGPGQPRLPRSVVHPSLRS
jgi:putative endonuclease